MRLTSTNPRTWVSVATLLTTMAFGCEGMDGATSEGERNFARKTEVGDAGIEDASDDGDSRLDGAVASLDGSTASTLDGAASSVSDDQPDAARELTDNQIFGVLVANNDAELSAAAAGEGKLHGLATIEFARAVSRSASAAKARHAVLARLAQLTPEQSEPQNDRERVASDLNAMLESEPPSDSLDLRYAFGEAMTNQLLVDLIHETLLPEADSELLKTELRTTREAAQRRVSEGSALVRALAPNVTPESAPHPGEPAADAGKSAPDAGP